MLNARLLPDAYYRLREICDNTLNPAIWNREVCVDRFPYDFVVDLEVAMRDGIARLLRERRGGNSGCHVANFG